MSSEDPKGWDDVVRRAIQTASVAHQDLTEPQSEALVAAVTAALSETQARREAERSALETCVEDLSATLVRLASGDFDARAQRDLSGSPTDVLAFLVNGCAEEIGALFAKTEAQQQRLDQEMRLRVSSKLSMAALMGAGLAHEINNPLTFVVGNAQLATDELRQLRATLLHLPEATNQIDHIDASLRDVSTGADRVAKLAGRLQRLSPTTTGKKTPCQVNDMVMSSVDFVRNIASHRATLQCDLQSCPDLFVDEPAMSQVVINLIHNAALAFEQSDPARNHIIVRTDTDAHGQARIEVHDNGVGMSPDILDHIFDAFFTTRTEREGTGLGLAISKQTVIAHGGTIEVSSQLGSGTTFVVTIPPPDATNEFLAPPPPPLSPMLGTKRLRCAARVVVIDDEPLVHEVIAKALSKHQVHTFQQAERALKHVVTAEVDLIFCDLMMPGMDGQQFYEVLATQAPEKAARVVFMTGGVFTSRTQQFMNDADVPVLRKPLDIDQLLTLAEQSCLGATGQTAQCEANDP